MRESIERLMIAITLVTGSAVAHGKSRVPSDDFDQSVFSACQDLTHLSMAEVAKREREQGTTCLDSNAIHGAEYAALFHNVTVDCVRQMHARMGDGLTEAGTHETGITPEELTEAFFRHYTPIRDRNCSTRMLGQGTDLRSAHVRE